jgi:hypothetical protein
MQMHYSCEPDLMLLCSPAKRPVPAATAALRWLVREQIAETAFCLSSRARRPKVPALPEGICFSGESKSRWIFLGCVSKLMAMAWSEQA